MLFCLCFIYLALFHFVLAGKSFWELLGVQGKTDVNEMQNLASLGFVLNYCFFHFNYICSRLLEKMNTQNSLLFCDNLSNYFSGFALWKVLCLGLFLSLPPAQVSGAPGSIWDKFLPTMCLYLSL